MTDSRPGNGALSAGGAGLVLFIALFLPWYSVSASFQGRSLSRNATGWEVLSTIDIVLLLVALIATLVVGLQLAGRLPRDRRPLANGVVAAAGTLGAVLALYRLIDIPTTGPVPDGVSIGREIGVYLAFLAAAGIVAGSVRELVAERAGASGRVAGQREAEGGS